MLVLNAVKNVVADLSSNFFKGGLQHSKVLFIIDGKRQAKIKSETHFFEKNAQKCVKITKKEESKDCCVTSCDIREGSCFQSSEKRQWHHQNPPTFYQINFFRVSFPGKQVPSEPTNFRVPSGLFRRLFLSFLFIFLTNEFEIQFLWSFSII